MGRRESPEVFTITAAQRPLSVEQEGRTRRYLVSMGVRTVCLLGAIVIDGWPRIMLVIGAIVLPYLAVVIANGGRENDEPGDMGAVVPVRPSLPGPGPSIGPGEDRPHHA